MTKKEEFLQVVQALPIDKMIRTIEFSEDNILTFSRDFNISNDMLMEMVSTLSDNLEGQIHDANTEILIWTIVDRPAPRVYTEEEISELRRLILGGE